MHHSICTYIFVYSNIYITYIVDQIWWGAFSESFIKGFRAQHPVILV